MLQRFATLSIFLILLLAVSVCISGIAEAQNNAPTTVGTIPNQTLTAGGTAATVDVSTNFSDTDGDTLTYTATSSDTAIATVSISSSTVTITPVAAGTATITVTATDPSSATATQSISVTVEANSAPTTVGTIPAQTLTAGGTAAAIDVSSNFSDANGDTLTYTASSSDTAIATVSVSASTVTITPVAAGTATITVTATDPSSATATQSISVTVTQPNRAPTTVGTIAAQALIAGRTAGTVDVSSYFSDADGDTLTYTATSSDTAKATVSVSSSTVTITPVAAGTATITVTATDPSSATATQSISVTVEANSAPTTVGTIPAQTLTAGGTAGTVDVSGNFNDANGDTLTYTARSSDTTIATVSVSESTVTITPVAAGIAVVYVTATDPGGLSVEGKFSVTVNSAPTAVGTIADQTLALGGTASTVDVSGNFSDADGDTLTYTATSSDTAKATVSVSESTVTITPVAVGTATITVTATDPSSATATQTFSVTTKAVPPAPTNVSVIYASSTFISVNWTAPTTNLTITGYDVQYRVKGTTDFTDASHTGTGTTWKITGVTSETTYEVRVRANITNDSGIWSSLVETTTLISPPTNVTVSDIKSDSATINWTAPRENIDKYAVLYQKQYDQSLQYTEAETTTTSITLSGLSPASNYIAIVAAIDDTKRGEYSGATSFWTKLLVSPADAVPRLSSQELLQLNALLTFDTVIFNELHNSSDDANDWLELRNVSSIDIPIDNWQLRIFTGDSNIFVPFPAGTTIPAGEVLLLTNTEMASADMTVLSVVSETFALPQGDFALLLRSPTAFNDLAGNYFQGQKERPATTPAFTVNTVWDRTQPIVSGYRAEAWAKSTYRNGLGSPGYQPSTVEGDLNNDGFVNILDLVLVASKFGTTGPQTADLNGDNTVDIRDLVLVANAFGNLGAAPIAKQSDASTVNNWLKLARQNESKVVKASVPKGFSYERGIQVLEQLARALTPDKTALLANYPNPFNPETWIPYQLSKAADVTITIYASDGNVVRTLALGHRDVGMYKNRSQAAYWDGTNEVGESVASGVYFYTLTAGDFSATRKMLILK